MNLNLGVVFNPSQFLMRLPSAGGKPHPRAAGALWTRLPVVLATCSSVYSFLTQECEYDQSPIRESAKSHARRMQPSASTAILQQGTALLRYAAAPHFSPLCLCREAPDAPALLHLQLRPRVECIERSPMSNLTLPAREKMSLYLTHDTNYASNAKKPSRTDGFIAGRLCGACWRKPLRRAAPRRKIRSFGLVLGRN